MPIQFCAKAIGISLVVIFFLIGSEGICDTKYDYTIGNDRVSLSTYNSYNKADNLYKQNKIAEAEPLAQALASANPKIVGVLLLYTKVLHKAGKNLQAYETSKKIVALRPSSIEYKRLMGNYAVVAGKYREAINPLKTYIAGSKDAKVVKHTKLMLAVAEKRLSSGNNIKSPEGTYLAEVVREGVSRWSKDRMPLKVFIASGAKIPKFSNSYVDVLKSCFNEWQTKSANRVSFQFVSSDTSADIECIWTADPKNAAVYGEGGHCAPFSSDLGMEHCEIVLLTQSVHHVPITDQELRAVALHEIGHSIGLSGHSNDPKDIMFSVPKGKKDASLSAADVLTLHLLYQQAITKPKPADASNDVASLSTSKSTRALMLNNQGTEIMNATRDPNKAIPKFQEALKLNPNLSLAKLNLGICFAKRSTKQLKASKFLQAEAGYKKAIKYMMAGKAKPRHMKAVYTNYAITLGQLGKTAEQKKYQSMRDAIK